ncbi:MAG: DUF721 domain-containing protein [Candidatus Omnitrophica bacterium]|nr:DUF721 domain-containing protein [Candidatus Omnitrophota bacterium]
METIKQTVDVIMKDLFAKTQGKSRIKDSRQVLQNVLTKKELEHIKFNYFKKGILSVNVDSPCWLYKLSLQKEELLAKLKKDICSIKDIRFRIADIR